MVCWEDSIQWNLLGWVWFLAWLKCITTVGSGERAMPQERKTTAPPALRWNEESVISLLCSWTVVSVNMHHLQSPSRARAMEHQRPNSAPLVTPIHMMQWLSTPCEQKLGSAQSSYPRLAQLYRSMFKWYTCCEQALKSANHTFTI